MPPHFSALISDVVNIDLGGARPTAVVIALSYNPAALGGLSEAEAFAAGTLFLAHLTPGTDGINGSTDDQWANPGVGVGFFRAYDPGDLAYVGRWGVDVGTHSVWAVLPGTISSQFAVTPEPATVALLAMGALALLRRRK